MLRSSYQNYRQRRTQPQLRAFFAKLSTGYKPKKLLLAYLLNKYYKQQELRRLRQPPRRGY